MTGAIHVLNGPNLNRLGRREPAIYGHTTLADVEAMCRAATARPVVFRQSNREYELIDWIHAAIDEEAAGIVINPAAFTFTSMAIMDALKMTTCPVIELHISNVHKREPIYHRSYMTPVVTAVIAGLGARGYATAIRALDEMLA